MKVTLDITRGFFGNKHFTQRKRNIEETTFIQLRYAKDWLPHLFNQHLPVKKKERKVEYFTKKNLH